MVLEMRLKAGLKEVLFKRLVSDGVFFFHPPPLLGCCTARMSYLLSRQVCHAGEGFTIKWRKADESLRRALESDRQDPSRQNKGCVQEIVSHHHLHHQQQHLLLPSSASPPPPPPASSSSASYFHCFQSLVSQEAEEACRPASDPLCGALRSHF